MILLQAPLLSSHRRILPPGKFQLLASPDPGIADHVARLAIDFGSYSFNVADADRIVNIIPVAADGHDIIKVCINRDIHGLGKGTSIRKAIKEAILQINSNLCRQTVKCLL